MRDKIVSLMPYEGRRVASKYLSKGWFQELQESRSNETGYSCFSFLKTKSIFVHIPKAAGISINNALYGTMGFAHAAVKDYQLVFSKNEFNDFFKFTIVRNPWDRMYSAYTFLKKGGINEYDEKFGQKLPDSFEETVLEWLTPVSATSYYHFIPQTYFLRSYTGKELCVDFIGRFENLEEDFEKIKERVNISAKLEHKNQTKKGSYKDVYSKRMINKVADIYRTDIELLKYSF